MVKIPAANVIPLKTSPKSDKSQKSDQRMANHSKILHSAKLRDENSQSPRVKRKVKRILRKNSTDNLKNASSTDEEAEKENQTAAKKRRKTQTPSRRRTNVGCIQTPGTPSKRLIDLKSIQTPSTSSRKKNYQCNSCEYSTPNIIHHTDHLKTHDRLQCDKCSKFFKSQHDYDLHQIFHKRRCFKCHRRFATKTECDEHVNVCVTRKYQCYLCKYVNRKNLLIRHMQTHHSIRN